VKLTELLRAFEPERVRGSTEVEVSSVEYDSRRVHPGSLFVALKGAVSDGRQFIDHAIERGAVAVLGRNLPTCPAGVACIDVTDPREALAGVAVALAGNPSEKIATVGITGTNGKTTTAFLLETILSATGLPSGLIGTVEYRFGGRVYPAERTTPEASDLQDILRRMVEAGQKAAVMEVSSHGLAFKRVAGCRLNTAVVTNVTRDHLDFHGTREAYAATKRSIFTLLKPGGTAVLNAADPVQKDFAEGWDGPVLRYGCVPGADVRADEVSTSLEGITMNLLWRSQCIPVTSRLVGAFNAENILAALAAAISLGVDPAEAAGAVGKLEGVPGRFEVVHRGPPCNVIVDYAHTDDALERLLTEARRLCRGRLIVVFGCGGDRDRTKRAPMGRVAERLSDLAVLTNDNPRNEDPMGIIDDIRDGMAGGDPVVIPNRRGAIEEALTRARTDDLVVIAGKGHETYQEIGTVRHPFDDRAVVREILGNRAVRPEATE